MSKVSLTRRFDWEQRFVQFLLDSREGIECDWKDYNCASWVCDAILEITNEGIDLYEEFRGKSKSPATAFIMIREAGYSNLAEIVANKLEPKPLAFVTRGDVILTPAIPLPVVIQDSEAKALGGLMWDGPRSGTDPQFWSSLGMPYAVCLADPPFAWNLAERGIERITITPECLSFDVGGLVCPQQ